MRSPLISVILPVYNVEQYLAQCLDSLKDQTFKNFEVICVNDGSTDASPEILEKYARIDRRIKVFHRSNGGVSEARNYGYSQMNKESEYIAVVDSDDVCALERFEIQVDYLEQHKNVDVLGGWMNMIGEANGIIEALPLNSSEISKALLYRCPICHPTVMIRRRFFDLSELSYDKKIKVAHDYDLWVKMVYEHGAEIVNVPQVLMDYRIHKTQTTKNKCLMESETRLIAKSARFRFLHEGNKKSFMVGECRLVCENYLKKVVEFVYLKKVTRSGKIMIKVCKIPLVYKKIKKR